MVEYRKRLAWYDELTSHSDKLVLSEDGVHGLRYDLENKKLIAKDSDDVEHDIEIGGQIEEITQAAYDALTEEEQNAHPWIITDLNVITREVVDNLTSDDADKALSAKQGKALKTLIDNKTFDVDDEMSDTSTNAIQNKAVKGYVDSKISTLGQISYSETNEEFTIPLNYINYNSETEEITISTV